MIGHSLGRMEICFATSTFGALMVPNKTRLHTPKAVTYHEPTVM